jgi:hypothetical protein
MYMVCGFSFIVKLYLNKRKFGPWMRGKREREREERERERQREREREKEERKNFMVSILEGISVW